MTVTDESRIQERKLSEGQQNILDLLDQAGQPLALRGIHARLPAAVKVRQVKRALARLKGLGLAAVTGRGVSARWKSVAN